MLNWWFFFRLLWKELDSFTSQVNISAAGIFHMKEGRGDFQSSTAGCSIINTESEDRTVGTVLLRLVCWPVLKLL